MECLFDHNWPLLLNFVYDDLATPPCWNILLESSCDIPNYDQVAEKMSQKAYDFCVDVPTPTPYPTINNSVSICDADDIGSGSHVLLSVDVAYVNLPSICAQIGDKTALLDGGYVFGSDCSVVKTDVEHDYDVIYCADSQGYCDFSEVLLSPNFTVDTKTTGVLVQLYEMLENHWGRNNWGVELRMDRSLSINAVGLYLKSLADNENLKLSLQDSNNNEL